MAGPTLADFEGRVGESFDVEAEGAAAVPLRLEQATALPQSYREEGAFRLEWSGPADPLLPQGIYAFQSGGEKFEMFIVPIARDSGGSRYEAIFI